MICSSQSVRLVNHYFTTRTSRGLVYALSLFTDVQFTNCTTRNTLSDDPYESYGSWTFIYTPSPSNDRSSQTVRLVIHCFTTRKSRTCRGLVYTHQVPLMICSSQTVRLVIHCFTTSTTRTNRTGGAKRNMPLYGLYWTTLSLCNLYLMNNIMK